MDTYLKPLAEAFCLLAEKEAAGMIMPIDRVGFFDLDGNGVPEIIAMGVYEGWVEYTAYDLFSLEMLSAWGWEGTQYGELSLWRWMFSSSLSPTDAELRSIFTHTGDGDDEYLIEIDPQMVCRERYAKITVAVSDNVVQGAALVDFRLGGQTTDSSTYAEFYERFQTSNVRMTETAMVAVEWDAASPADMAERILLSGQLFPYTGK